MFRSRLFLSSLFAGAFFSLGIAAAPDLTGQQPAVHPAVARTLYSQFKQIHVDQDCGLLPDPAQQVPGKKKLRPRHDFVICHVEGPTDSEHMEEMIEGNERLRNWVSIHEQTYVLQDVTTDPVTFVVEQAVPKGWVVDSDPQPVQIEGAIALFLVNAQPGQTVQLHVGLRHAKPLKTKMLKKNPLNGVE